MRSPLSFDVIIVGSGVAGLVAAVHLLSNPGIKVGILTKGELSLSATQLAQGGIAAVLGDNEDSADFHFADTCAAGAGLCDLEAVRMMVDEAPGVVAKLIGLGATFDSSSSGGLSRLLEGGHSMPRVIHAKGAATGAEIERALVAYLRGSQVAGDLCIMENCFVVDLLLQQDRCKGVVALNSLQEIEEVFAPNVILATGGTGQMYSVTTNPLLSTGDGIAIALRRGIPVADVEFVQFHPTALYHSLMPRPLLSEALRGHGAKIRDTNGERFVDELLPRDAVSRAMAVKMIEQSVDHLWLDVTELEDFFDQFPTIAKLLNTLGLDPSSEWLPIAPAAHYISGGIITDLHAATGLPGLWAVGETACTGVHGANRLASNSLLEGMVFATQAAHAILEGVSGPEPNGVMKEVLADNASVAKEQVIGGFTVPPLYHGHQKLITNQFTASTERIAGLRDLLEHTMTKYVGVLRSKASLVEAGNIFSELENDLVKLIDPNELQILPQPQVGLFATDKTDETDLSYPPLPDLRYGKPRELYELVNLFEVGVAVLQSAYFRTETRGSHVRTDYPDTDPAWTRRFIYPLSFQMHRSVSKDVPVLSVDNE
ncbi:MAG: L-aspartate oxidase [Actinobacteria bacterium]|nr:L-aspartate oxidase [Actinomycetota bacterium]MCL6104932.1 L-aspartate oxidase [Actinomycetota bacterium]